MNLLYTMDEDDQFMEVSMSKVKLVYGKIFTMLFVSLLLILIFSTHTYARTISAPHIKQLPELPRGCEVTSLAMMLQHAGVQVSKMELAKNIRKVPFKTGSLYGNPYEGFVGNMYTFSEPGLGVYNGPIQEIAEKYLPNRIVNLTGRDFSDVYRMLDKGMPVWVITNSWFSQLPSSQFKTWQTKQGPIKITYREHSVLITGYDAKYIYINDPLYHKANRAVPKNNFIAAWNQMGKQAISYYPKNTSWYIDTLSHTHKNSIQALAKSNILNDTKDGFYQPNRVMKLAEAEKLFRQLAGQETAMAKIESRPLTRADLSQYLVKTFEVAKAEKVSIIDVPSTHKAYSAIQSVVHLKWIPTNSDGSFKPNQPITKAELASALSKAIHQFWFRDIIHHSARDEISYLKRKGLISGISSIEFGPNILITRAQAAAIINQAISTPISDSQSIQFVDVSSTHPFYSSINKMVQLGFMDMKNQRFYPNKPLTRQEMAQLFARSFTLPVPAKPIPYKDVPEKSNYFKSIQALSATRILSSSELFQPEKELTRAQFASILAKLLKNKNE
jgi:uncharacterized protein YvpB